MAGLAPIFEEGEKFEEQPCLDHILKWCFDLHHAVNCYQALTRFERARLLRYKGNPYIQKYKMKRSAPETCANTLRRGIERVKKRRSKQ